MLSQQKEADWLFKKLNKVMIEECYQYRKNEQPQLDSLFDAKQWEQFVNTAQSKIRMSKQCLAPLVKTAEYWGMNKVQYYEWASMGLKYCNVLAAAASQNPVWEDARVKLNQLLLRRITEGRFLRKTANPFYLVDLEHLIAWTGKIDFEKKGRRAYILKYKTIAESDLPVNYVLDRFGSRIIRTKLQTYSREVQQPSWIAIFLSDVLVIGKYCECFLYKGVVY
ncbi:hypothetical protein COCSADRAFT_170268 [Bipolaris sorokiniana ND90Pr]|uniref:Uncharacterized protein n=1 Tax=Cochliobolus sativus (strain ND90Pr / ATCC 201652) TaxID=665912 RepID=M2RGB7_COCSN|nr:uncharacterized protein COCSADRAFT_170268 [Bipolaris sorokiniana ND90Pr]EMD65809.1 hypothetical protein COCSADRAFT_170268 [Bipolaris sorokiniana ND90Pr]